MFFKELDNGKYRYYEKFYHEREEKWKQVSVTLKSKSRVSQAEAKRRLALKIEKLLTAPTKEEVEKKQLEEMIFSQLLEEWRRNIEEREGNIVWIFLIHIHTSTWTISQEKKLKKLLLHAS